MTTPFVCRFFPVSAFPSPFREPREGLAESSTRSLHRMSSWKLPAGRQFDLAAVKKASSLLELPAHEQLLLDERKSHDERARDLFGSSSNDTDDSSMRDVAEKEPHDAPKLADRDKSSTSTTSFANFPSSTLKVLPSKTTTAITDRKRNAENAKNFPKKPKIDDRPSWAQRVDVDALFDANSGSDDENKSEDVVVTENSLCVMDSRPQVDALESTTESRGDQLFDTISSDDNDDDNDEEYEEVKDVDVVVVDTHQIDAKPELAPTQPDGHGSASHYFKRIRLVLPADRDYLSDRQIFVRSDMVEICEATDADVAARHATRGQKLNVGQVGIRCVHCAHLPLSDRAKYAVCYPSSTSRICKAIANMNHVHFEQCREIPPHVLKTYKTLKTTRPHGVSSKAYWNKAAKKLGLVNTETGMRFEEATQANRPSPHAPSMEESKH